MAADIPLGTSIEAKHPAGGWRPGKLVEVKDDSTYVVTFVGKKTKYTFPRKRVRIRGMKKVVPKKTVIIDLTLEDDTPKNEEQKNEESRHRPSFADAEIDVDTFFIDRGGDPEHFDPYAAYDDSRDAQPYYDVYQNQPNENYVEQQQHQYDGWRHGSDQIPEPPPPPPQQMPRPRVETAEEKAARMKTMLQMIENRHPPSFMEEQERMLELEKKKKEFKEHRRMRRRMHMTVGRRDRDLWKKEQLRRRKLREQEAKRKREAKEKREKRRQRAKTQKHQQRRSQICDALVETETEEDTNDEDESSATDTEQDVVESVPPTKRNAKKRPSPDRDSAPAQKRRPVPGARVDTVKEFIPMQERIRLARFNRAEVARQSEVIELDVVSEHSDAVIYVDTEEPEVTAPESPHAWINSPGRRRRSMRMNEPYIPTKTLLQSCRTHEAAVSAQIKKIKEQRAKARDANVETEMAAQEEEEEENDRRTYNLRARNRVVGETESEDETEFINFEKLHIQLRLERFRNIMSIPEPPVVEREPVMERRGSGRRKQARPRKNRGVPIVERTNEVEREIDQLEEKLSKALVITPKSHSRPVPKYTQSCTCAGKNVRYPWLMFKCYSCGEDVHAWCAGIKQRVRRVLCLRCAEQGKIGTERVVIPPLVSPLITIRDLRVPTKWKEIEQIEELARIRIARTFQYLDEADKEKMARNVDAFCSGARPRALLDGPCERLGRMVLM